MADYLSQAKAYIMYNFIFLKLKKVIFTYKINADIFASK